MKGPEPGLEILPGLTLLRRLGRGGMGEAWLARDAERGEDVVAKVVPADAPSERVALLRREARLVRKLKHPRIVPVYGFRSGERWSVVTLRHMSGGDAGLRLGAPAGEIVALGRDVADALAYLHDVGVVHRDVKLSNVLLDDAGRAHLADFGIASVAKGEEDGLVLRGGGSRASMSPQQRAGAPPQPADDLYALGVLLFELLSGEPPAAADTDGARPAAAPQALASNVPARLQGLVTSLLAPLPEGRPRSATAVRDELEAIGVELTRQGALQQQPAVRLQPPPRVADGILAPKAREGPLEPVTAQPGGGTFAPAQLALLGGLALLAVAAVVWLPRWAAPPAAPALSSTAASPAPELEVPPMPVEAPSATLAPASAEAPPEPGAPESPAADPPRRVARDARVAVPPDDGDAAPASEPASTPVPAPTPDRQAEAAALARHREDGNALAAREDWRGALREYEAALAIDAHVTFALEGKQRAEKRAALVAALEFHSHRPQRLSTPAVAREAEALLERARGAQPSGPALQARIAALEAALAEARTPVAVVIESDGLTELTLSRVGRIGPLTRRSLDLLPGTYTLTGSRRGYRDVRRQFSVAPGAPGPTVTVRCEEAL